MVEVTEITGPLLPPDLKKEVSDYVDFLLERASRQKKKIVPKFGSAKGKIRMAPDFDAPTDDFKAYM